MKDTLVEVYCKLRKAGFFKNERKLIPEILSTVGSKNLVVELPTGYGKSAISYTAFFSLAYELENFWRVIHVLPLRSIIEDLYRRLLSKKENNPLRNLEGLEKLVGRQSMNVSESPFLNRLLVFTTYDTFALNMCNLPTAEIEKILKGIDSYENIYNNFGHPSISKGSIFDALNVLDEPHMIVDEENEGGKFLTTLIYALKRFEVPTVIMSATITDSLKDSIRQLNNSKEGFKFMIYGENGFIDKDFENIHLNRKIETKILQSDLNEIVKEIKEKSKKYNKNLVILNTVERAKQIYNSLRNEFSNVYLLHGKIMRKDRSDTLNRLEKDNKWILISTQVVEAGVDLSAETLVSDLAPPISLIQRAGRLLRSDNDPAEGEILFFYDSSQSDKKYHVYSFELVKKTYEKLKEIKNKGLEIQFKIPKLKENNLIGYDELKKCYNSTLFSVNYDLLDLFTYAYETKETYRIISRYLRNIYTVIVSDNLDNEQFREVLRDYTFQVSRDELGDLLKYDASIVHYDAKKKIVIERDKNKVKKVICDLRKLEYPQLYMIRENIVGFNITREKYLKYAGLE